MENKEKRPVGRPAKYTLEELQEKAIEYLKVYDKPKPEGLGSNHPSHVGFALFLGISKTALYDYKDKYKDFLATLDEISSFQEFVLTNNGLDKTFNPMITKLMLANHGYHEKIETTNTSSVTINDTIPDE